MSEISDGNLIFLVLDQKRMWLRKCEKDKELHTDKGYFHYNDILGKKFGSVTELTPSHKKVAIFKPLPSDIVMNMKRESQIIYPEDIGLILTYGGIIPGSVVFEAGIGSGTVTSIMAMFVQRIGRIYSYDNREVALQQAKKNLEMMDVSEIVTPRFGDICEEKIDVPNVDFIMLDLATPWFAIPKVFRILKETGRLCTFSPTIEQVKKANKVLIELGAKNIVNLELMKRTMQIKPNATRPETRMIGHTGYLTFATKSPEPLPSSVYESLYAPENIGFALIYAGIRPGTKLLVISQNAEKLSTVMKTFLGEGSYIHPIVSSSIPNGDTGGKSFAESVIQQMNQNKIDAFDTILYDKDCDSNWIEMFFPLLNSSGIACIFSQYIDHAKEFTFKMQKQNFIDIKTYELIKRQINIQAQGSTPESQIADHPGYVTIGRKVLEEVMAEEAKIEPVKTNSENSEFVDLGIDLSNDSAPKKKIDWANLTDEQEKNIRK